MRFNAKKEKNIADSSAHKPLLSQSVEVNLNPRVDLRLPLQLLRAVLDGAVLSKVLEVALGVGGGADAQVLDGVLANGGLVVLRTLGLSAVVGLKIYATFIVSFLPA